MHDSSHDRVWDAVCTSLSIFGRLASLAALRQPESGKYHHPLADELGADEVDQVLRKMHGEVFRSWIALKLPQQERDLSIWLAWLDRNGEESSLRLRQTGQRLEKLVPAESIEVERQLFFSDFRLVVSVMELPDPCSVEPAETAEPTESNFRRVVDSIMGLAFGRRKRASR